MRQTFEIQDDFRITEVRIDPESTKRYVDAVRPVYKRGHESESEKEFWHVTCLQQTIQALIEKNYEWASSQMTEDVELEFLGGVGEVFYGGKGKQAVMQAAIRNYALLEVQKPELISLVAKGDVVVVVAKESGKVCATQREYELHFIQHFTFCDGKIAKIFGFCDSQSLIDAVKPVA